MKLCADAHGFLFVGARTARPISMIITNYALLKEFRVILRNNAEALLGNLDGVLDIFIGKRSIDEVVVMACKENTAAYHFGNPLLMKHKAVIVGDSYIE